MPRRKVIIRTDEVYHVYNRSIARQPILTGSKECQRFLELIDYYRFEQPGLRFSHFNRLQRDQKSAFLQSLYNTGISIVDVYAFSIMPNHFHILAKQLVDDGIKTFVSLLQNSYAKYYNTKFDRFGSIWQEMFKAVRIETDEQFLHVSRYIHINPLTEFIISNPEELVTYPLTSFTDYMGKRNRIFVNKAPLLEHFNSIQSLKTFTFDNVEYQRSLREIKHLLHE